MALIAPKVWTRQPQSAAAIDWNGPLGSQIDFVIIPAYRAIIGRNTSVNPLIPLSGGRYATMRNGMAFSASGGTSDGFNSASNFSALNGASSVSAALFGNFPTMTGALIARWSAAANFGGFLIGGSEGAAAVVVATSPELGTWYGVKTSQNVSGVLFYGMTWKGGKNIDAYLNGKPVSTTNWFNGTPTTIQSVNEKLYLCRHGDSGTGDGNSQLAFAVLGINRMWNAAFHATLAANPYQIFRPLELSVPTCYPILSNLQATRGNTSASLRTNINY